VVKRFCNSIIAKKGTRSNMLRDDQILRVLVGLARGHPVPIAWKNLSSANIAFANQSADRFPSESNASPVLTDNAAL
jgi:hypothetical protein